MAKQTMIAGTEDEFPEEVASAAEAYLKFKRLIAATREKMNAALDALILRMREADIEELRVDDGEKRLILCSKDLVQIKRRKKNKEGEYVEED